MSVITSHVLTAPNGVNGKTLRQQLIEDNIVKENDTIKTCRVKKGEDANNLEIITKTYDNVFNLDVCDKEMADDYRHHVIGDNSPLPPEVLADVCKTHVSFDDYNSADRLAMNENEMVWLVNYGANDAPVLSISKRYPDTVFHYCKLIENDLVFDGNLKNAEHVDKKGNRVYNSLSCVPNELLTKNDDDTFTLTVPTKPDMNMIIDKDSIEPYRNDESLELSNVLFKEPLTSEQNDRILHVNKLVRDYRENVWMERKFEEADKEDEEHFKAYMKEIEKADAEKKRNKYDTVNINEDKLQPQGGVEGKYHIFYTGQGYNVTADDVLEYGKTVGMSHVYWGTDAVNFSGSYNGDTYVLYEDIENLPESYQEDARNALIAEENRKKNQRDLKSNNKQYYRFDSVEEATEFNSKKHMRFVQESTDDSVYVFDNVYDLPEKERESVLEKIWASQKTSDTLDIESISDDDVPF